MLECCCWRAENCLDRQDFTCLVGFPPEEIPCCLCKGEGTCVRCACTTPGRPCDDCYPARRNRCQNSAPPSASFNLPVVQSNDGAEFRTPHVILSSQPVRGSSATFARWSQTKIQDAGARSMSQPLLQPRSDSSQLTGTSSHHQPTGNQSEKLSLRSSKENIEKTHKINSSLLSSFYRMDLCL